MDDDRILNHFNLQSDAVAIFIVAVALALILYVNRRGISLRVHEWRVERCLQRIGSEQIRKLSCPDGLDGYYEIDRLALTGDAILLISYKPYGGILYCGEQIAEWTQVVGQRSFKFENPLFELEHQLTALRAIVGSAPLHGFLFFDHNTVFPKGHPPSVLNPENIPERYLADYCEPAGTEILAAWSALKALQGEAGESGRVGAKT